MSSFVRSSANGFRTPGRALAAIALAVAVATLQACDDDGRCDDLAADAASQVDDWSRCETGDTCHGQTQAGGTRHAHMTDYRRFPWSF